MVELRTRMREIGGDGWNQHEKLWLQRMLCASYFTIPELAGKSPDLWWYKTDMRSSHPNLASRTPDIPYPLVFSTSLSSSSPISILLVHNPTIIAEHIVKSSLSNSACHDHELTPSTACTEFSIHRVQHTPSIAYTEYSIHWVQHPPNIGDLSFIVMTTSWPFNVALASSVPPYIIYRHQPALHGCSTVNSFCHIPTDGS